MAASILMIVILAAAGAGALASARRVASGYGLPALAVITVLIAFPLWITCDRFLLKVLPPVEWFDPKEPFAPYFLLYLPLSVLLAIPPAAALIIIARARAPVWKRPRQSDDSGVTMRTATIATLLLITGQGSAYATASLGCEVADRNVKLVAEGIVSRGMREVFVSLNGELEVLAKGAPSDLKKVQFTGEHLTQRWAYGKALKLRIYRDEPSGSVELVIEAQAGRDGLSHRGWYVLALQEGQRPLVNLRGRVSCSLG